MDPIATLQDDSKKNTRLGGRGDSAKKARAEAGFSILEMTGSFRLRRQDDMRLLDFHEGFEVA